MDFFFTHIYQIGCFLETEEVFFFWYHGAACSTWTLFLIFKCNSSLAWLPWL